MTDPDVDRFEVLRSTSTRGMLSPRLKSKSNCHPLDAQSDKTVTSSKRKIPSTMTVVKTEKESNCVKSSKKPRKSGPSTINVVKKEITGQKKSTRSKRIPNPTSIGLEGTYTPRGVGLDYEKALNAGPVLYPSLMVKITPSLVTDRDNDPDIVLEAIENFLKQFIIHGRKSFVDKLKELGLVRPEQSCGAHKSLENVKMVLQYTESETGKCDHEGYVWVAQCCKRKLSVFAGSFFEQQPQPYSLDAFEMMKVIFHWAKQTVVWKVINLLEISDIKLAKYFTQIRSTCIAALHDQCPQMGGSNDIVELGIFSRETTVITSTGEKKEIQLRILIALDPGKKIVRMKVVNDPNDDRSDHGIQTVIGNLTLWIQKDSCVKIFHKANQGGLTIADVKELGFCDVQRLQTQYTFSRTRKSLASYMSSVFRMFSRPMTLFVIQQLLDELSWRELWGTNVHFAMKNFVRHLNLLQQRHIKDNSVIKYLDKIATNPMANWSQANADETQEEVEETVGGEPHVDYMTEIRPPDQTILTAVNSPADVDVDLTDTDRYEGAVLDGKDRWVDLQKNRYLRLRFFDFFDKFKRKSKPTDFNKVKTKATMTSMINYYYITPMNVVLQSYYYGSYRGTKREVVKRNVFPSACMCPKCGTVLLKKDILQHVVMHLQLQEKFTKTDQERVCIYCLHPVKPSSTMSNHVEKSHKLTVENGWCCRICSIKFDNHLETLLHMWHTHCEAELPYRCELCGYRHSFLYAVIDHFEKNHSKTDALLCPICCKVLNCSAAEDFFVITDHIKGHLLVPGLQCGKCALIFRDDCDYGMHQLEVDLHSTAKDKFGFERYIPGPKEKPILMAADPNVKKRKHLFENSVSEATGAHQQEEKIRNLQEVVFEDAHEVAFVHIMKRLDTNLDDSKLPLNWSP